MLELVRFKDPNEALGLTVHLLARAAPFSLMTLGNLYPIVAGAIQREHYAFAKEDGRVVGVLGWGFADLETSERWVQQRPQDVPSDLRQGPCVLILALQAERSDIVRFLTRSIRETLFPDRNLCYFIRMKVDSEGAIQFRAVRMKRPGSTVIVAKAPEGASGKPEKGF